ncbi:MAG: YitT family protein [Thermotogota bacterium]
MNKLMKKVNMKKEIFDYSIITVGTLLTAIGIVLFLVPYNIVAGGVSGLAIVMNELFGWWVGLQMLVYNVFLFALGFKLLGLGFGVKSIYSAIALSVFTDLSQQVFKLNEVLPNVMTQTQNPGLDMMLMTAVYGAIVTGAGMGLVIWRGATTGGTDILAIIFNKYFNVSVGTGLLLADSVITASAILISPILPMYGIITIFIMAKTIDGIVTGLESTKTVLIISDYHDRIKEMVYQDLDRGLTYLKASGGYTQKEKNVLMVTISRSEVGMLKNYLHEIDENAFVIILPNNEALGYGFKKIK